MKIAHRILFGLALSASLLLAQADPPGRVARISYVYGAASFRPGDVDDWFPVDFNRPLTTGDHLYVDVGGTAELQIGSAALRTNSTGSLEFLNLDDNNVQLRLTSGSLIVRLRYLGDQDSFEVDTPNLAFSLLRTGEYRIEVKPDSSTTLVTVRGGEGELTGPTQAFPVHAGEMAQVIGTDQPSYQTMGAPPRNDFDTWSLGRDQHDDQSPSARYVSRELIGYQDLDQYGSWRNTPDYGAVWVPNNTPAGWAPYHYGHWVWVDPWGWTWVDDAQWGFAPFPLWPLGLCGRHLGLGTRPDSRAASLRARISGLGGRWRRGRRRGLVRAGTARALYTGLSHQPDVSHARECHQYGHREQRSECQRNQCPVCESRQAGRRNGGAADSVRKRKTRAVRRYCSAA